MWLNKTPKNSSWSSNGDDECAHAPAGATYRRPGAGVPLGTRVQVAASRRNGSRREAQVRRRVTETAVLVLLHARHVTPGRAAATRLGASLPLARDPPEDEHPGFE